jgi:hypothetical protein
MSAGAAPACSASVISDVEPRFCRVILIVHDSGLILRNHLPHMAAMDLFVFPTISFNLLFRAAVPVAGLLLQVSCGWTNARTSCRR